MKTDTLRGTFLEFFKSKGHVVFPSDNLVPDDPSVLFTSAGMNQFKPYFLGEKKDVTRAASCQKCLRTDDLEKVGQTAHHHTFFEMLGNFSFGDYFKKEAIEFAWEFATKHLNLKSAKLWVSVYEQDSEAYDVWHKYIGLAEDRIIKLSQDTNFWPANAPAFGPDGPCGPCSEIFFDRGKSIGCQKDNCSPACSCGRFVEFWNLVFTQFNRKGENNLEPLPQKNIDTGMGLERIAMVLQNKESNFEIDILQPAVELVRQILGVSDKAIQKTSLINAIVDHSRAATFVIADGIYPSNEERGYVVRKLIRTALWKGYLLGEKKKFLYKLVPLYAELMLKSYPQINEKKENIEKVILAEEEKFLITLKEGRFQFEQIAASLKNEAKGSIGAQDLFRLYDTYGLPLEMSREMAKSYGIEIDDRGFSDLLKKQQELSRKKSMFDPEIFRRYGLSFKEKSEFIGYENLESSGKILRLIDSSSQTVDSLAQGTSGIIVLDKTPFYPESGGQLSDRGSIFTGAAEFLVEEVFKINDAILHKGKVIKGTIRKAKVHSRIDQLRRAGLARAHTATHLLQAALRKVLGAHITQQGSYVDVDRLRFDFTHHKALTNSEIENIEAQVNRFIFQNDAVKKEVLSYQEAKHKGALAFFKDKYGAKVRVISVSDYSKELCGGTHLANTSQIGIFFIASEASISSGIRRIEAIVAEKAYSETQALQKTLKRLSGLLKCSMADLETAVVKLQNEVKKEKEKSRQLDKQIISLQAKEILLKKKEIKNAHFLVHNFKDKDFAALLYLCDILRKENNSLFIFLLSSYEGSDIFVCSTTGDLNQKGISANKFISSFGKELSLKGGGKDTLAQGVVLNKGDNFINNLENCFTKFVTK